MPRIILTVLIALSFSSGAIADCEPNWKPGNGPPAIGMNRPVYSLTTYNGDLVYRDRTRLALRLLHYTFRGDYLVDDVTVGVLGRNVLNALVITVDGPHLSWSTRTS